jgi:sigma-B regulation protein RsbU (phosphoserine phosphatase)
MEIARTIQMNLLPKVYPDLDGYEISAMSLPAKQVGGDYYDFIRLPDGRMVLAIADVSGKGVPAAILTATTRSYLQSETQHPSHTLAEIIESINRMVHRDVTNDMYVTMAIVALDEPSGKVQYVNAGHSHPILMDRSGGIDQLDRGGVFLGIMPEANYDIGSAQLGHGDLLVLDTDGVTDIHSPSGEPFGIDRLLRLLKDNRHLRAEEIRNIVYQSCLAHRGEADQFDDFTLIVLKRREFAEGVFDELEMD